MDNPFAFIEAPAALGSDSLRSAMIAQSMIDATSIALAARAQLVALDQLLVVRARFCETTSASPSLTCGSLCAGYSHWTIRRVLVLDLVGLNASSFSPFRRLSPALLAAHCRIPKAAFSTWRVFSHLPATDAVVEVAEAVVFAARSPFRPPHRAPSPFLRANSSTNTRKALWPEQIALLASQRSSRLFVASGPSLQARLSAASPGSGGLDLVDFFPRGYLFDLRNTAPCRTAARSK